MTSRRSRIYIDSERGEREDREVSHLTFFFGCRFFGGGESFVFRGSRMTWIFCRGTCVCVRIGFRRRDVYQIRESYYFSVRLSLLQERE